MTKNNIRTLTRLAILIALAVVLGRVGQIPTPTGFLTLVDAVIFFTAFSFGSPQGAIVGGGSAFLLDLLSGYPNWMLISLVAHGAQGYFAGWTGIKRILGLVLSSLSMIGIYFLGGWILYGLGGSLAGIWSNVFQNFLGMVVGYLVYQAYKKSVKS